MTKNLTHYRIIISHPFDFVVYCFLEHTPQLNNYSPGRQKLHDIVTHRYFELIVASIIGLNILAMSLEHWSQPKIIDDILMYSNWFFTLVFVIEMSLKIFALGFGGYLADKWNQLDMVIVFLSVIGIALEVLNEGHKVHFRSTKQILT